MEKLSRLAGLNQLAGLELDTHQILTRWISMGKGRMKNLNEKELDKMCAIGRAAARLFDEKGYLETSLRDISNSAKLSKGGIYHYFSSKHDILYFILDNYMEMLLAGLEEALKGIADSPSKIRYIVFRHLRLYNKKVPEAKALLIESHNLPKKYFRAIAEKQKQYAQITINVLSDLFGGRMPTDKLKAISYTLFGMCNSIMYWYDPKGPVSLEELSQIVYDIFMKGVASYRDGQEKIY
ncbi:MAG: TetR/AcrR family transcriptional regulator [Syntrophaceae bacterium]|nr:TetR/AcrR family transcriptional regulator [Syntrophaceae bacterium]